MRETLRIMVIASLITTAIGFGYAKPVEAQIQSWSEDLSARRRFVVLRDLAREAALDRETGLVWQLTPQSHVTNEHKNLSDATLACLNATTGGKRGWRVASAEEMLSLSDPAVADSPTLPTGHPFRIAASRANAQYLTSSTLFDATSGLWAVVFVDFRPVLHPIELLQSDEVGDYWCVRGGSTQLNSGVGAP
jgi:hypothetical protein